MTEIRKIPDARDNSPPVELGPLQSREISARFAEKVRVNPLTGCWIWRAYSTKTGYAQFQAPDLNTGESRLQYAHRVAYESIHGPVPEGFELDHLCARRNCVNPAHLEPVTRKENLMRGDTLPAARAAQTHCQRGHELSGDNVYTNPSQGSRTCRICRTQFNREWAKKNRERRRELDRNHYHAKRKSLTARRTHEEQGI